jgi:hypothetical protein
VYIFWREMVDTRIAANITPISVVKGLLRVSVKTSPWLQESRFFQEKMVADINAAVGGPPLVTDVRFSLDVHQRDPVDHDLLPRERRVAEAKRPTPRHPPCSLSHVDQAKICAETSTVEDDDLRATIENVRLRWNC